MTLAADAQRTIDLAEAYVQGPMPGAEQSTLEAFFDAVSDVIDHHDIRELLAFVSESDADDAVKTFVERSLLDRLARSPNPNLIAMKVIFACQDYESLMALSKNPDVDDMNRLRARRDAQRVKQAYMSQFD